METTIKTSEFTRKYNKILPLPPLPKQFTAISTDHDRPLLKDLLTNPNSSQNSARTNQPPLMINPLLPPPSNEKPLKNQSIMKKPKKNNILDNKREDCNGFPIIKGGKNHRITFKNELVRVITVESFKKYNMDYNNLGAKHCLKSFCVIF